MYEILSIGEILVDLMPYAGRADGDGPVFEAKAGGSAANVACVTAKLGHSTAFVGKVGPDAMGEHCIGTLRSCGVDTALVKVSDTLPTTLALVAHDAKGDRSFGFYRTGTADTDLSEDDVRGLNASMPAKYVHFGGVSLTKGPLRDTVLSTVKSAKKNGSVISYDPNLRESLWDSLSDAKAVMSDAMRYADILKISEEEGEFFFGQRDHEKIFDRISEKYGVGMILITCAERGCVCRLGDLTVTSSAYDVKTVDTTGAGDAFLGGVLHSLLGLNKRPDELTEEELKRTLDTANAVGSLVTTAPGAIDAIPNREDIDRCMAQTARI
ncbi:MAG: carbohydrate kinase [Clostridiales Family XIII bacterium]|jgi:fructokinase|nr:carbohydrate kinase [Clostridiales Family XIII bacterium]